MTVELVSTGTELLLGEVAEAHLAFVGRELRSLGLRLERQTVVPDGMVVRRVLEDALFRSDVVLVTGGLGATSDDNTREAAAEAIGRELEFQPAVESRIRAFCSAKGIAALPEAIRRQAMVPKGAQVLWNSAGPAPGLFIQKGRLAMFLLPGPPRELVPMWRSAVVPWLRARANGQAFFWRSWWSVGLSEWEVQERVERDLRALGIQEIGYCERAGEVELRIGHSEASVLDRAEVLVKERLGSSLFGGEGMTLEGAVIELATRAGRTIATAESCTGGLVAHRLTDVPGSSAAFTFGWIAYANAAKVEQLGVAPELLEAHGAVSSEVAEAMAAGALRRSGADLAVSVTGIAGPTGGTPEKPVGLVWFGLAAKGKVVSFRKIFPGDRSMVKRLASQAALDALRRALLAGGELG
ncbi:CinA-like protein [Methylacidimicrobium sp. AP8]|uniref:CinA family nicotinamide mononucleotide deamidase-related protein n=1 Tax=Methylacidimicrobium sp. AP8 TaxID=2730359 RepID=UPI0018C055AE|nr:CinA family nicotinamide mononucleotide deamidase-related protein [Methylacidimicrobium sp. AP8]CAB4243324.1 CinA-like protein [Methylacidimicrobium sp. AP8]